MAQIEPAVTFFDMDVPALLDWRFGPTDAGQIRCPDSFSGEGDLPLAAA